MCGHFWVHHTPFHLICKIGESMEPRHSRYWFSGARTDNKDILKSLFFFCLHFASKYLTFCSVFERYLVFGFAPFLSLPARLWIYLSFLTERNKAEALRSRADLSLLSLRDKACWSRSLRRSLGKEKKKNYTNCCSELSELFVFLIIVGFAHQEWC